MVLNGFALLNEGIAFGFCRLGRRRVEPALDRYARVEELATRECAGENAGCEHCGGW